MLGRFSAAIDLPGMHGIQEVLQQATPALKLPAKLA
jgi:hypothetical protein